MRIKNQKYNKPIKNPGQKSSQAFSGIKSQDPFWLNYVLLGGILLITFWCYHYSLKNEFTNWDDNIYVYENPLIKSLSFQNLKLLICDTKTGNFHPITMLSFALNWHFSGANPQPYYITQIVLHLVNTILVFYLSLALFNAMTKIGYGKIKGIPYLAAVCALWHGIHPMHVESVSWLAERKDLLYFFFYLSGLIVYIRYVMENKIKLLFLVAFLFIMALFSKPMALVFPYSLFTIDILLKRKLEWKLLIEKIPLISISFIWMFITFNNQVAANNIISLQLTFFQRIDIVFHNYLMYLFKWFAPLGLSSYYPYPDLTSSNRLPFYFYCSPVAAIAIITGLLYIAYKKGENYFRVTLFGLGFYFFNVMLVLQFVSAGVTIMADRYSYVSYIGFTFMVVYFLYVTINTFSPFKTGILILTAAFSLMLSYLCQARTEVWHNSETLWKNVIKQYPSKVSFAYENLGVYYYTHLDYDKAYHNFKEALNLKATDMGLYLDLGSICHIKKLYDSELDYYSEAIKADSNYALAYIKRGNVYYEMDRYNLAINDYKHYATLEPFSEDLLKQIAFTFLKAKQYDSSIMNYSRLIQINPIAYGYFCCRGIGELNKGAIKPAIADFFQTLQIAPHDSECMFYLSLTYHRIQDFNNAFKYAQMAQNAQYAVPENYIESLKAELHKN